jgi:hypothetical protein
MTKKLKSLTEVTEQEACAVAQLLHPGNDRCTIIKNLGDGRFKVDIDSRSSVEYSLEIELDFAQLTNPLACSHIHGIHYRQSVTMFDTIRVYLFLLERGYDVPQPSLASSSLGQPGTKVKLDRVDLISLIIGTGGPGSYECPPQFVRYGELTGFPNEFWSWHKQELTKLTDEQLWLLYLDLKCWKLADGQYKSSLYNQSYNVQTQDP